MCSIFQIKYNYLKILFYVFISQKYQYIIDLQEQRQLMIGSRLNSFVGENVVVPVERAEIEDAVEHPVARDSIDAVFVGKVF
jgi:hypothetical protein